MCILNVLLPMEQPHQYSLSKSDITYKDDPI